MTHASSRACAARLREGAQAELNAWPTTVEQDLQLLTLGPLPPPAPGRVPRLNVRRWEAALMYRAERKLLLGAAVHLLDMLEASLAQGSG